MHNDHEWLKQFTHDPKLIRQLDECVAFGGNVLLASKSLKIDNSFLNKKIKHLRDVASVKTIRHGDGSLETTDEGFSVKGTSTLYKDGKKVVAWVKTSKDDKQKEEGLKAFVEGLAADLPPIQPVPLSKTNFHNDSLMTLYAIGDAHIGMLSFSPETKDRSFSVPQATLELRNAITHLVDRSEATQTAILANMGDLVHINASNGMTAGMTPQDSHSSLAFIMQEAAATIKYMVNSMLTKHSKVILINVRGNHDLDTSIGINLACQMLYSNEPRVTVLDSFGLFHFVSFGKNLLAFHHGHSCKPEALINMLASTLPAAWGNSTYRCFHIGHYHRTKVQHVGGGDNVVRVMSALGPVDSWHKSKGYGGSGQMTSLTYSKSGGLHSEHTYTIPMQLSEPDITI